MPLFSPLTADVTLDANTARASDLLAVALDD